MSSAFLKAKNIKIVTGYLPSTLLLGGKASRAFLSSCHDLTRLRFDRLERLRTSKYSEILQRKFMKEGYFEVSFYSYLLRSVISESFFFYLSIREIYDK